MGKEETSRDPNLDFVKGALVIFMVIYHTMNYYTTSTPESYAYIRFVSGAFIFISGYLVSNYYQEKYILRKMEVTRRLIKRGVKLFLIFSVVNFALALMGVKNYNNVTFNLSSLKDSSFNIFILGDSSLAAFEILLPISYLLVLSPLFLLLVPARRHLVIAILAGIILCSFHKIISYNFYSGLIGLAGFGLGLVGSFSKMYRLKSKLFIAILLVFWLSIMGFLDQFLLTYCLGIFVVLKLLYDLSASFEIRTIVADSIVMLGQHSLLSYLIQVLFLQALSRFLGNQKWELGLEAALIMLGTSAFLLATCISLKSLQRHSKLIRVGYSAIFS